MLKLKNLVEIRMYGRTISDLLDEFQQFEGRDLIFFDTETLGFNPTKEHVQLTQIGIIVVDGSTMEQKKSLNLKIELNEAAKRYLKADSAERKEWELKKRKSDKSPNEILNMTGYFNDMPQRLATERDAISLFAQLINNSNNPILIAHNATFDMKFVNIRAKIFGINIKKVDVIDTLRLAKYYLIPILQKLNKSDVLEKMKNFKDMKVSDIKKGNDKKKSPKNTEYRHFNAKDGTEMLRIIYGKPSASLSKLTSALIGKIDNWHDALADVKSMISVYEKILEILYANRNVDISKLQADEYIRFKKYKNFN